MRLRSELWRFAGLYGKRGKASAADMDRMKAIKEHVNSLLGVDDDEDVDDPDQMEEESRTTFSAPLKLFRGAKGQRGLKRPATQTLIGSGVTEGWTPQARKPGMAVDPAYSATAFRLLPRSLTSISLPAFRER